MTREEALAICFTNLKGPKDKDLMLTARALEYLKSLPEYGSNQAVGKAVGVSGEIVREFLTLLRLPKDVQQRLERREFGLEQGRRLWQLGRHRPELVSEAAETMSTLNAVDGRHFVDYLLRHPESSVTNAKTTVLDSKTVVQREFHIVAILSEEQYRHLVLRSRRLGIAPDEAVSKVVVDWLNTEPGNGN